MATSNACFNRFPVIMVVAALYAVMLDLCEDRSSCSVTASPETFTQDPCQGTIKYLEVHYKCRPNEYQWITACEGEELQISCAKGGIAIYSAMFGRSPNGSNHCPPNKHGYIDCQASDAVTEVRSFCHGKKNCAIEANESHFGDPCPDGTNKYLSVNYACVPRKILKPMKGKKNNHKKKKKKKKKVIPGTTQSPQGDNTSESSVTQVSFYEVTNKSDSLVSETEQVTKSLTSSLQNHIDHTTESYLPKTSIKSVIHHQTEEPAVGSLQEDTSKPDLETHIDVSTTNSDDNGAYYKSFEDVTSSELIPPGLNDSGSKTVGDADAARQDNDIKRHGSNSSHKNNLDHSNIKGHDSQKGSSTETEKDNGDIPSQKLPNSKPTSSHNLEITLAPFPTDSHNDNALKENKSHMPGSNGPVDKTDLVTERNLTVLCSNYTPDVRWGGMQKPSDQNTIGFLKDWFAISHYLKTHEEKAWLYFSLGICFGIIVMLVVVLAKVCFNFHRNIQARLDVSEPTHRSALINNHSSLDAPMLEHSDSMDRIEVVRFSPRSTLRSLRSDSHDRNLVNYYG
ncbi:protein eva-1 C [Biomphalaria pfeifferi]|uniref:Protein eva-1 C n=1 Tax=Biomphalaria pfeifferi TaxID=112525 RepID=A0AAD8AY58_BIOPF|nr:protein eva-1 C [Biomphalaria pfeifferi]